MDVNLCDYVDSPAISAIFAAFIAYIEKSGPSFDGSRQSVPFNQYCNFLDGITEQLFTIYRDHPKSKEFRSKFTQLLVPYGYRASTAAWVRSSISQQKFEDLATLLKEQLKDPPEKLRANILQHLYKELIVKAPHSVVQKAELFNPDTDMILIRGPAQYGKTNETVLTAWRAFFDGERLNDTSMPACATFSFIKHSNADPTIENLKRAVEKFNDTISKEIWTHFSYYASLDLAKQFHIRIGTTYDKNANRPQLIFKKCNANRLGSRISEGITGALTANAYLLFDDDDDAPAPRLRPGESPPPPEMARGELLRLLKVNSLPVPASTDDESARDVVLVRAVGTMTITSTPESLLVEESTERVRFQKLDLLVDAPVKPDYYGCDKRLPDDRRPKFAIVEPDYELPPPPKTKVPRRKTATTVALPPPKPKLQYNGEGLNTVVQQIAKSDRQRNVLVYSQINPEAAGQGSLEETQDKILENYNNLLQQSAASERGTIVLTYCGGAKDQDEAAVKAAGWKYRGKLTGSKNVVDSITEWFAGKHICELGCKDNTRGCGHCAAKLCDSNVVVCTDKNKDRCVVYNRKVHIQDMLSMIATCLDELEASRTVRNRPHIIIVTGKAGCRRVSYRSYDGAFYLTDLYMSYHPLRISAATGAIVSQLMGRLCFLANGAAAPKSPEENDGQRPEPIKLRVWCSKPVRYNMQALMAACEGLWRGRAEQSGVMDVEALGISQPTQSPYIAVNALLASPKAKDPFAALALPEGQELLEKLTELQQDRDVEIKVLSEVHTRKEKNIHKLPVSELKERLRGWFPDAVTMTGNWGPTQEALNGIDPSTPTAVSDFWPDLWYHVLPNEIVIIHRLVTYTDLRQQLEPEFYKLKGKEPPLQLWHRFRQHHSGKMVELVARKEDWFWEPEPEELPVVMAPPVESPVMMSAAPSMEMMAPMPPSPEMAMLNTPEIMPAPLAPAGGAAPEQLLRPSKSMSRSGSTDKVKRSKSREEIVPIIDNSDKGLSTPSPASSESSGTPSKRRSPRGPATPVPNMARQSSMGYGPPPMMVSPQQMGYVQQPQVIVMTPQQYQHAMMRQNSMTGMYGAPPQMMRRGSSGNLMPMGQPMMMQQPMMMAPVSPALQPMPSMSRNRSKHDLEE